MAKVKLVPEDVEAYINHTCCDKEAAEKALREADGSLKAALSHFAVC